jgi:hypothetical protein
MLYPPSLLDGIHQDFPSSSNGKSIQLKSNNKDIQELA